MSETDLIQEKKWHFKRMADKAMAKLNKNGFEAVYAADCQEALTLILEMVPEGSVVGSADSMTLDQIGVFEHIHTRKPAEVLQPLLFDEEGNLARSPEEMFELQRRVLTCDVYICGANAVTLDGKLVSVDGTGNRVAPMVFGPQLTIIVVGANKIVADVEAARERIRNYCAPMNVKRHIEKHKTGTYFSDLPCAKTGFCADCKDSMRICASTVILESAGLGALMGRKKKVAIVGEELGI